MCDEVPASDGVMLGGAVRSILCSDYLSSLVCSAKERTSGGCIESEGWMDGLIDWWLIGWSFEMMAASAAWPGCGRGHVPGLLRCVVMAVYAALMPCPTLLCELRWGPLVGFLTYV